jgi:hypothetical protein
MGGLEFSLLLLEPLYIMLAVVVVEFIMRAALVQLVVVVV